MERIKEIIEKELYKNMSELDMKMCIYREFSKFDDDALKEKFVVKMLEKRPDKEFRETPREQVAKDILYLDVYQENPPCFFDEKWIPTVEELDEFTPEEIDYLVHNVFVDDYRFYGSVSKYRKEEKRHKKICEIVDEYRRNK